MRLSEIARRLECELRGGDAEISRVMGIEKAGPGDLTFIANRKYVHYLKTTRASAVILGLEVSDVKIPSLRTANPYLAFARAIEFFYRPPAPSPGIDPTAVIHSTSRIGANASIGAHVVVQQETEVGNDVTLYPNCTLYPHVRIGDGCMLHSNVVVREYVQIGKRCVIQNGAVIGGDGFGFAPVGDGTYHKIVQSGTVVLEDDVEVGANSTIDRAAVGETRIRCGAKIDNLVQIGHGSDVGENTVLAAQVGIAGSTVVGKNVMLGGQVGAAGHLRIGDRVVATAQTGIPNSVEEGKIVSGYPAIDNIDWRKASAVFPTLPQMQKRIRELEKLVAELRRKSSEP
ncbi:MAG: UDP-3-O-(3-hydroxymyristoyl)glucosamine N-acyltransferase [Acidobacteria bacterium]|nr:UDP-3-O-(3-hydroxymyristoyl)glucosamine N-acyltransferase [Acidobacteriota bacterium]